MGYQEPLLIICSFVALDLQLVCCFFASHVKSKIASFGLLDLRGRSSILMEFPGWRRRTVISSKPVPISVTMSGTWWRSCLMRASTLAWKIPKPLCNSAMMWAKFQSCSVLLGSDWIDILPTFPVPRLLAEVLAHPSLQEDAEEAAPAPSRVWQLQVPGCGVRICKYSH